MRFRDVSLPQRLMVASVVGFAVVFALILAYGRPGLGLAVLARGPPRLI